MPVLDAFQHAMKYGFKPLTFLADQDANISKSGGNYLGQMITNNYK